MYGVGIRRFGAGAEPPMLECPNARTCCEDSDRKDRARRRDLESIVC